MSQLAASTVPATGSTYTSWGLASAILALIAGLAIPAKAAAAENTAASQVRETRDAFNLAIEAKRTEALSDILAPEYVLVTGRGDRFDGRDANVELWRGTFEADPTFNCLRTPEEIVVNSEWGLAQETGHWVCTQTVEGEPGQYTGVYAAKWQRAGEASWLLQAEVFTTLTCKGPEAACQRPDPVTR